jgi:hypothetical protein
MNGIMGIRFLVGRGLAVALWLAAISGQAQSGVIQGWVRDVDLKMGLPGATVRCLDVPAAAVATDVQGAFRLEGLPVGRHAVEVRFIGYETRLLEGVIVTSGRPVVLEVDLRPAPAMLAAAEVEASRPGEVLNEMAVVSARAFSVEETDRYAGSRGDPARMASNFAGVQGADDSRNDIVVRGNSPFGVLWRVEGVDLPNPNHFSIPGTVGGPVAILNNKMLANSDFFSGAFPAEFGNSTAAVFDLRLRNGNPDRPVRSFQLGFLGTEAMWEGPLGKNRKATLLMNYRYSTAGIFSLLGIDIGTSAVPRYQDGSFRLHFPQIGKRGGSLALWGIAGKSGVDILISDQVAPERNIYGENDRDQYFSTGMGMVGATYHQPWGERRYVRTTLAGGRDVQRSRHDLVYRKLVGNEPVYQVDSIVDYMRYGYVSNRLALAVHVNERLSERSVLRYGINVDATQGTFQDSIRTELPGTEAVGDWERRWDAVQYALLVQPFFQWKFRPSARWDVTAGWHMQYHSQSGDLSAFEPRLGMAYRGRRVTWTGGLGMHSQLQPSYLYAGSTGAGPDGTLRTPNAAMGMTRSLHAVAGGGWALGPDIRVQLEVYQQWLWNIPVDVAPSSFSLINGGSGFSRLFADSLVNEGVGRNRGIEVTVSRAFRQGWFALFTGSVFDARYAGSDGVWRNTEFNGRYAFNFLASREWRLGPQWGWVTGIKGTTAGGRWYGPVDTEASAEAREIIFQDADRNTLQFDPYFRLDIKTNLVWNRPEATHELGIDFVNVTNRKNVLKLTYAPDETENPDTAIREEYQLGFLPIFFYRVDF